MRPLIHRCLLCGHTIGDDGDLESSWGNMFRLLYSIEEQVEITSVGYIDNPGITSIVVPLDSGERWECLESNVPNDVSLQGPVDGRYSFPFHDACWSLLEQAYSPKVVPLRRLVDVCRSLPFSIRLDCVTWDHNYGGLISEDDDCYPWENLFVNRDTLFESADPYRVPEIQQLPSEAPTRLDVSRTIPEGADIFSELPLELINSISLYLPTHDYLNARLALRSFYAVFHTQQFWASRFFLHADRAWVFESQNWDTACDWLWQYRRTANGSYGMRNRERVWRLVEKVQEILSLQWIEPISQPVINGAHTNWRKAAGDLQSSTDQSHSGLDPGCRLFRERIVHVPSTQLTHVGFSLVQPGSVTYITGIRLVLSQGEPIRLGYSSAKEYVVNATCLTGLILAVGSRGIQAIKCILDNDQQSSWIGCPNKAPRTNRLLFAEPIVGIQAGFDGYKLVSLAANGCVSPGHDNLRNLALWYPEVPEPGLCLNESGFTARKNAITRYEPICWTMFGGPAGMYLRKLTGISVTGHVRTMEFHYNSAEVPVECRRLGKCTPSEYDDTLHFDIDGPSGELINSLTVFIRQYHTEGVRYYNAGRLSSFKVSTNYGRSYHFACTKEADSIHSFIKTVTLVEGSIIQGLYWTQHENAITALGAISKGANA